MRDSSRTDELLVAEELTSSERFHALVSEQFAGREGRFLLDRRPVISRTHVDLDALARLPGDTFGHAYCSYLARYGLDPDVLAKPVERSVSVESAYLHERYRQTHDLWHVLCGLGTSGYEEILITTFSWAQLRLPYSALVVLFGGIKHLLLERRWRALLDAMPDVYRNGRDADRLLPVYWEQHWADPIDAVRARYGVRATPYRP